MMLVLMILASQKNVAEAKTKVIHKKMTIDLNMDSSSFRYIPTKLQKYSKVKVCFDVICLAVTFLMTYCFLGHVKGLGIGTVLAAFTLGKVIGMVGEQMEKKWMFTSVFEK